ncbi:PAS domain S-box protein [soil metagenome]
MRSPATAPPLNPNRQELRTSEERFRQFAENSSEIFWIVDRKSGQLEYLNPVYETIMGEPRDLVMADIRHWLDLVHPEDRAEARLAMPRLMAGQTSIAEYRIIRSNDGAVRWIRDAGFIIRNAEGAVSRVAGVAQDVTEEKYRSEALATSEERFRLLVDGARDYAIFQLDPGNRIIYWSAGAERNFGWTSDEALGKSGRLIFTPEDRVKKQEEKELAIALRHGSASDRRWHMRKDGSRIWVDGIMRRLDDEQGNLRGFAKIARDATEQRKAEEELRKSHTTLERRVRERTAELSKANRKLQAEFKRYAQLEQEILLVSEREKRRIGQDLHDSLCQELAAAAFFLQSAAHKSEKRNPGDAGFLSEAAKIVNANVGVARDLARGLYPVELTSSGLTNALRELAYRCNQTSTRCTFECPRAIRVRDDAIALNLYRIAQEAVSNSIKNGQARNVVISLRRERGKLILIVQDDGRGFAANRPTKGMGIHIMKYRAHMLGGALEVDSKVGRGTRVSCTLARK